MSDGVSATSSTNNEVQRQPPPPPPPPPKVEPQQWGGADRFEQGGARTPSASSATSPASQQGESTAAQPDGKSEKPGVLGNVGGFFQGAWEGGVDTVKGLGNMAQGAWNLTGGWLTNPEASKQTVDNVKNTASTVWNNPGAVVDAVTKPITDAWSKGEYGKAIGRGTFDAASMLLGTKGLDKVAKLGRVGEAATVASNVGKAEEVASAASKIAKVDEAANAAAKVNTAAKVEETAAATAKAEALLAAKGRDIIPGQCNAQTPTAEALKHPPGAERAAATAKNRPNWQQADMQKAIDKLGPDMQVHPTSSGKVYYTDPNTGAAVVHDPHANYFRAEDLTNNSKRQYLDQNLNPLPPGSPDYLKNTHFRLD
jgi:hypothetical protein